MAIEIGEGGTYWEVQQKKVVVGEWTGDYKSDWRWNRHGGDCR